MKLTNFIHIENKKIKIARNASMVLCLILALFASMILTFYHSTEIVFQFYLGYTLLRLSIIYLVGAIMCSIVFDKFITK